ncbi:MAG: hypothetical protein JNK48_12665 [Bryobacterales bacterium]|nr:hypothetical protein [Bryobacterales bacterium]
MPIRRVFLPLTFAALVAAQPSETKAPEARDAAKPEKTADFRVDPGTHLPLSLVNQVSTKSAKVGARVYLETAFPLVISGRMVIPPGSYVMGTVTEIKRPGRLKGRGEIYLRFDSLILPNGVTRDFRARVSGVEGINGEQLNDQEGKVVGEGNKSGDARTIGETAVTGTWIGTIAGASAGRPGMGAGIGAAAGAAAGMVGVLLSRGPDLVLPKGSTIEMVLDRPLFFNEDEIDFSNAYRRGASSIQSVPASSRDTRSPIPGMSRRPLQ